MKFIFKYIFVLVSILLSLITSFYLKEDLQNLSLTVLLIGLTSPLSILILRGRDLLIIKHQPNYIKFDKYDLLSIILILLGIIYSYSFLFIIIFIFSKLLGAHYLIKSKLLKLQFIDSLLMSLIFNSSLILESKGLIKFDYLLNIIIIIILFIFLKISFKKIYLVNEFQKTIEKNEFFTTIIHLFMQNSSSIVASVLSPFYIYEAKLIQSGTNLITQLFLPPKNYIKNNYIEKGKQGNVELKSIFKIWIKTLKTFYFIPIGIMILIFGIDFLLIFFGNKLDINLSVIFNKYIIVEYKLFAYMIFAHVILPPSGFILFGYKNGIKNLIATSAAGLLTILLLILINKTQYISLGYFIFHLTITNLTLIYLNKLKS